MAQVNPTAAANIAYNATQFGAIPQVQSPAGPRPAVAAFPGSPLAAPVAGAPVAVAAPFLPRPGFAHPAAFAPAAPAFAPAAYGAVAPYAPAAYGAVAPYTGAAALYGAGFPAVHPAVSAVHPAAAFAGVPAVQPAVVGVAGAVPAAFNNALVATGPQIVDDWSAAHGYGYPASYGYGALAAAPAAVAVGGVAGLYDSRVAAAVNPALYAASYGAPFNYTAPSYVPSAVQGVPTFNGLAGFAGTVAAAPVYGAPQAAAFQVGGLNAYAPGYFNAAAGINTFAPTYFGGFNGHFAHPAALY